MKERGECLKQCEMGWIPDTRFWLRTSLAIEGEGEKEGERKKERERIERTESEEEKWTWNKSDVSFLSVTLFPLPSCLNVHWVTSTTHSNSRTFSLSLHTSKRRTRKTLNNSYSILFQLKDRDITCSTKSPLLNSNKFHWILLNSIECHWMSLNSTLEPGWGKNETNHLNEWEN